MIYLNGQFLSPHDANIKPTDRGFLLSDGLFETGRTYQGKPLALEKHWVRLKKSAELLELPIDLSYEALEKILTELFKLNAIENEAIFRLTITRGSGARGLNYPETIKPTVMIAMFPYIAHIHPTKIGISTIRRNEYSPLANIKSLACLDNVLARREITKRDFDEAILLNTQGHVAEASAANIFMVTKDHVLVTPQIKDGVLPGITREIVLELADRLSVQTEERSMHLNELLSAQEIFITNSIIEIQEVKQIEEKKLSVNPITQILQTAYKTLIKDTLCKT